MIHGSCNATGVSVHGNCSSQRCLRAAVTTASAPCGSMSLPGEALPCTVQFSRFKQQVFTANYPFSLKTSEAQVYLRAWSVGLRACTLLRVYVKGQPRVGPSSCCSDSRLRETTALESGTSQLQAVLQRTPGWPCPPEPPLLISKMQ